MVILEGLLAALYEQGESEIAMRILNRLGEHSGSMIVDVYRGYILAESNPTEARKASDKAAARPLAGGFLWPQTVFRFLGDQAEAIAASKVHGTQAQMPAWMFDWLKHILAFNSGQMTVEELLREAGPSRRNLCEAHFHIVAEQKGLEQIFGGHRPGEQDSDEGDHHANGGEPSTATRTRTS